MFAAFPQRPWAPDAPGRPAWRPLSGALAATLALWAVATFWTSNWSWGVSFLHDWPLPAALGLILLAVSGFVPRIRHGLGSLLERLGRIGDRGGWAADAAVGLLVAGILFSLRDSLQLTGDFDLRVHVLEYDRPPTRVFPQAAPLDLAVNFHLPRLLMGTGMQAAPALQAVGSLVGGCFTVASLALLRAVGARGPALVAAAAVVLCGGYLQHFAGYDKFGPLLLGVAIAGTGAVKLASGDAGWTLAAGSALCVLSHRAGFLVLPASALLFLEAARRTGARRSRHLGAAALALIAVTLAAVPWLIEVVLRVDWKVHQPGGAVARSFESPDAPAALVRFSNLLNALFLLAPLWPVGVTAALHSAVRETRARVPGGVRLSTALAMALGAQAAVLLAVGATRGSGRDWDAAAAMGVMASLATACALVPQWRGGSAARAAAPHVTVALAIGIAVWGPHASEAIGRRRIESLLADWPAWSATARAHAYDLLGMRALERGRYDEALHDFERAFAAAPNPRYVHQAGIARLSAGQAHEARAAFLRAAFLMPAAPDPWFGLARAALDERDSLAAAAYLDSLLMRDPGDARGRALRQALRTRLER